MYYRVTNTDTEHIMISNITIKAGESSSITDAFIKIHWNQFKALVDAGLITMESVGSDPGQVEDGVTDLGPAYERMVVEFSNHDPSTDNPINIDHERGKYPSVQVYVNIGSESSPSYQLVDENYDGGYDSGLSTANRDVVHPDPDKTCVYLTGSGVSSGIILLLF